jgi:hypothetical protein
MVGMRDTSRSEGRAKRACEMHGKYYLILLCHFQEPEQAVAARQTFFCEKQTIINLFQCLARSGDINSSGAVVLIEKRSGERARESEGRESGVRRVNGWSTFVCKLLEFLLTPKEPLNGF